MTGGGAARATPSTARTQRFLTAEWRELALLNFAIDPAVLRPLVPAGTELDEWERTTYVSVVGLHFVSTRVLGFRIPGHSDFSEVNLRFYVRRRDGDEWRRGVVFIREIVPRRAIAWIARWRYNEPYRALPMRRHVTRRPDGTPASVRYEWRRNGHREAIEVPTRGEPAPLVAGSEARFITEHYWGYTRQRDGSTVEYRVEHPSWRVWDAAGARLDADVASLYGPAFVDALGTSPRSTFLAEGSPVIVFRPQRLAP